jgi:hypothetical protein
LSVTRLASECPLCGAPLVRRSRRDGSGDFLACGAWRRTGCAFVESIDLSVERVERELRAARADVEFLSARLSCCRCGLA